jgi:hypothetical protein
MSVHSNQSANASSTGDYQVVAVTREPLVLPRNTSWLLMLSAVVCLCVAYYFVPVFI